MKTILLGEAPAKEMDGFDRPAFTSMSGRRLSKLIGCEVTEVFETMNLLDFWPGDAGKGSLFPREEACRAALKVWKELEHRDPKPRVILAGRRVATAMAVPKAVPYLTWIKINQVNLAVLPHPSGINQWWNDLTSMRKAQDFLMKELTYV